MLRIQRLVKRSLHAFAPAALLCYTRSGASEREAAVLAREATQGMD